MENSAIVLGAGIQGSCVALMLQKHGYTVKIIDKEIDVMMRASLTYEGKIHLGFVYGLDKSLKTGRKMIEDALHFAPYVDYLLDQNTDWASLSSKSNVYLVHEASMIPAVDVYKYFSYLDGYYRALISNPSLNYLGGRPDSLFNRCELPTYVSPDKIVSAFRTAELSVDQAALRAMLRSKLFDNAAIEFIPQHRITEINRDGSGFRISFVKVDGSGGSFNAPKVFNCLWEGRTKLDAQLGFRDLPQYSMRLKYGLLFKANDFTQNLDSISIIHGPFGNIVTTPGRTEGFCSWYPACLRGMVNDNVMPAAWEAACSADAPADLAAELGGECLSGFQEILPGLSSLEVVAAKGGVIVAEGERDIDDPFSRLHTRYEQPVLVQDGYYSLNTSKYTSAPRNTMILENQMFGSETMAF